MIGPDDTTPTPTPTPTPTGPQPPPPPPAWRPPPADHGRNASLVFGVIILLVGLWFFADRTLGLALPRLAWSQIWPVFIIGLGLWIVLGSFRRSR